MEVTQFLKLQLKTVNINVEESETTLFYKCFNPANQHKTLKFISERNKEGKNSELSSVIRKKGNIYYEKKEYAAAMNLYYTSIQFAPYGSLDYAMAIANRSAILFGMKRYEDCLVDINRILDSKYPKLLMNKIFIRQVNCLVELERYEAAVEVVNVFKLWLENEEMNLTQRQIDNILKSINDIEKLITANRETVDSVEQIYPAPSFIDGENPHFAYASKTVAFSKNRKLGRHVIAKSNIRKGDILFIEDPYSTSGTFGDSGDYTYCNQCFTCVLTCIACKFCTDMCFCSEQCRELFWNTRHKWECEAICKSLLCSEYSLALATLFRASQTGFNCTVLQKDVYGNKDNNYPYVNQLATHITDIRLDKLSLTIKAAVFLVTYLIHFTDYFDWLSCQDNRPEGSLHELCTFVGGVLLKTLLQIGCNADTVQYSYVHLRNKSSPGFTYHTVAQALYVSSSSINHSCVPNAVRSFHGKTKIVKALMDVPKGKEITICYLSEPNISNINSQQRKLMQNYYFTCTCRVCSINSELYPWLCNRCQGQALTTSNGRRVKCLDCQHISTLRKYAKKERFANMRLFAGLYLSPLNAEAFLFGLRMLKHVYFPNNYKYIHWYSKVVEYCDKIGDFRGCLNYLESMNRIQQVVFGDTAVIENLNTFLRLCVSRVNYCLSLNTRTSENYKKTLNETVNSIHHCADLLSYHMCPKLVDCFKTNMLEILAAGTLDYDETTLSFHFNNIPRMMK